MVSYIVLETLKGNTISKNILKEYMRVLLDRKKQINNKKDIDCIINTLLYNKIIISEDIIREQKIENILS